jgi:hypothetical protein
MSEHPYHLKCKWAIATHARAIIAVSILICVLTSLIVLTGFVTPASAYSPATLLAEEEPEPPKIDHMVDQTQEVSTTVDTSTFAYTEGERLSNTNTYPLDAAGNMRFTASAVGTETTLSEHRVLLQYEATISGEETAFWKETSTLEETTIDNYEEGETVSIRSLIDIDDVHEQIQEYDNELGQDASVSVYTIIETDYSYESSESRISDDEPVIATATATHKQEIVFGNSVFSIPTSTDTTATTTGGLSQSTDAAGGLTNITSAFLFLISGANAGYCYRHRDDYDAEAIEMKLEELQNQDWITLVDEFDTTDATSTSVVPSLRDIINLAIDKGDRAVFCYDQQLFIFVHEGTEYIYDPPEQPLIAENVDVTELDAVSPRNQPNTPEENGVFIWEDNDGDTADTTQDDAIPPTNGHDDPSVIPASKPENPTADAIDRIWIEK